MVERHLAKVDVAGSSPVSRSTFKYKVSSTEYKEHSGLQSPAESL